MEGPISFWGCKEQESNLILPEHDDDDADADDDDDDDDDDDEQLYYERHTLDLVYHSASTI